MSSLPQVAQILWLLGPDDDICRHDHVFVKAR
jgi:hypothetical protein